MRDYRPFLQIVHAWGLRAAAPGRSGFRSARALARAARAAGNLALARDLERVGAHDAFAAHAFRELLERVTIGDPLWRRLPTWLADSGDRSALGDRESLTLGDALFREFAAAAHAREALTLPGPRDFWPGSPPALRASDAIAHAAWARVHAFPARWPETARAERAPSGRVEVQLFALDTVDATPTAALNGRARLEPDSLERLRAHADAARRGDEVRALRIVVAHHPPADLPADARDTLAGATPGGGHPLAHVVLHARRDGPSPPLGALAPAASPLALSIGPLLGFDPLGEREGQPQQCQVLRCYYSTARPSAVLLERLIATRAGGVGPFRFARARADGEPAEELVIHV